MLLYPTYVPHPTPPHPSGCPHHRARRATNVPKGIAAEEPLFHKMRLRKKNTANIVLHRESNSNQESEGRRGGGAEQEEA